MADSTGQVVMDVVEVAAVVEQLLTIVLGLVDRATAKVVLDRLAVIKANEEFDAAERLKYPAQG